MSAKIITGRPIQQGTIEEFEPRYLVEHRNPTCADEPTYNIAGGHARSALASSTTEKNSRPPTPDRDGDALRLAIEHRISIKQKYGRVTANGKFTATVKFADCGGDRCAATRLAITRAAGLTMNPADLSPDGCVVAA